MPKRFARFRHVAVITMAAIAALVIVGTMLASRPILAQNGQRAATTLTIGSATVGGPGGTFLGNGVISGGSGNSRLLMDEPPAQRQRIFQLLFRPGYGGSAQWLKIEIGSGSNASDGSEPSIEPQPGRINCAADYEFAIAKQAQLLNPALKVYALQWAAPGWVRGADGTLWTGANVRYVFDWLTCAHQLGVTVNYLGGWNERGNGSAAEIQWFNWMHAALRSSSRPYLRRVQLVADDSRLQGQGPDISGQLAGNADFRADVALTGTHDPCGLPTTGTCRRLEQPTGKPALLSELGMIDGNAHGAELLARSLNNAWIQGGYSGTIIWPMLDAMPPNVPYQGRVFFQVGSPWSGAYQVSLPLWVLAQTNQFVQPGWRYLAMRTHQLAAGGTVVGYRAPRGGNWSVVAETTTAGASQQLALNLPDMSSGRLAVWHTNLASRSQRDWFVHGAVTVRHGKASVLLVPDQVYTITTITTGHKGASNSIGAAGAMPLPYTAHPDVTGAPRFLADQEGTYRYEPGGAVFDQVVIGTPVFWNPPLSPRHPFALIGSNGGRWGNDTIQVSVQFTAKTQTAGILGRCGRQLQPTPNCLELRVSEDGSWRLCASRACERTDAQASLARGHIPSPGFGPRAHWVTIRLQMTGRTLKVTVGGRVAVVHNATFNHGPDGLMTGGYYRIRYKDFSITPAG